ncbi:hypothetical protein V7052_07570, partial [Bacillus wiedmannii]|uniref:hypothetical protein n=1 Tax=Bacillus wiedmannii TaxID=1890302 RepID=UPI002FFE1DB7
VLYNCIFVRSFLYNKTLYKGKGLIVAINRNMPKIINEEKTIHIEDQKIKDDKEGMRCNL